MQVEFKGPVAAFYPVLWAEVVGRDELHDAALLRLEGTSLGQPFEICGRGLTPGPTWYGTGFPQTAAAVQFLAIEGTVTHFSNALTVAGSPQVIQLSCIQAASGGWAFSEANYGNDDYSILQGVSGAPVCLPCQGNRVVGFIRCAPGVLANTTIYATPVDAISTLLADHIPNLALHPWIAEMAFVRSTANHLDVESNIDENLIGELWSGRGPKDLNLSFKPQDHPELAGALARFLIHSSALQRIQTTGSEEWKRFVRRAIRKWIPCATTPEGRILNSFSELQPEIQLRGTQQPVGTLSALIHRRCDRWTLDKINALLEELFDDPSNARWLLGYNISADLAASMCSNWRLWRQSLDINPSLLHHFLALVLTPDGEADCSLESCQGIGPLTTSECLLPSIAFSLALAPLLPESIAPKALPGNVGNPTLDGHSCGIVRHLGLQLDEGLQNHTWKTRLVFLCSLTQRPAEWQAEQTRLTSALQGARPSLDRLPPTTNLILCDSGIRSAMASSANEVRQFLQRSFAEFDSRRTNYESAAANILS